MILVLVRAFFSLSDLSDLIHKSCVWLLFCFWYVFFMMNMYVPLCMSFDIYTVDIKCVNVYESFALHSFLNLYKWAVFLQKVICIRFSLHLIVLGTECIFFFSGGIQHILISLHPFRLVFRLNGPEYIISLHCYTEESLCFSSCLMTFVIKKKYHTDMARW